MPAAIQHMSDGRGRWSGQAGRGRRAMQERRGEEIVGGMDAQDAVYPS